MKRPAPLLRFLALLWASLQVAMPAASSVADGLLVRESARGATAHVESSTTASCPVVHAPDCGVCRYLSACGSIAPAEPALLITRHASSATREPRMAERSVALLLPDGRAPPRA